MMHFVSTVVVDSLWLKHMSSSLYLNHFEW